jgi:hypothetical protein
MAEKSKIQATLEKDRCVVRMAPEEGFSKYWPDWITGRGASWPAALRALADKIDKLEPAFKKGRTPHDVKAAAKLRRPV